jgi:hypothetical protein
MESGARRRGPKPRMDTVEDNDFIRISKEVKVPQTTDVVAAENFTLERTDDRDGAHVYRLEADVLVFHNDTRAIEEIFLTLAGRVIKQEAIE